MNNKKGISLIVLVITIIVMIILAGVVIVSLQKDNPINKAKEAKLLDSVASVRTALSQYVVSMQANVLENNSVEEEINKLLVQEGEEEESNKKVIPILKSNAEYIGFKKLDTENKSNEIKKALGVDALEVAGKNYKNGAFFVNPKTGASVFIMERTDHLEKSLGDKEGYLLLDKKPKDINAEELLSYNEKFELQGKHYNEFKILEKYNEDTKYVVEFTVEVDKKPFYASVGIGDDKLFKCDVAHINNLTYEAHNKIEFEINEELIQKLKKIQDYKDYDFNNLKSLYLRIPRYENQTSCKGEITNLILYEVKK